MTVLVTHFSADKPFVIVRFVQRDLYFQPAFESYGVFLRVEVMR